VEVSLPGFRPVFNGDILASCCPSRQGLVLENDISVLTFTDGTLPRSLMPDLLHPNEKGYQIWSDAMESTLAPMLRAGIEKL
jgi:lysophospholipase L1-like esterase